MRVYYIHRLFSLFSPDFIPNFAAVPTPSKKKESFRRFCCIKRLVQYNSRNRTSTPLSPSSHTLPTVSFLPTTPIGTSKRGRRSGSRRNEEQNEDLTNHATEWRYARGGHTSDLGLPGREGGWTKQNQPKPRQRSFNITQHEQDPERSCFLVAPRKKTQVRMREDRRHIRPPPRDPSRLGPGKEHASPSAHPPPPLPSLNTPIGGQWRCGCCSPFRR